MKKILICIRCGAEFMLSEEEMEMYERAGFSQEPKRCQVCRGTASALQSAVKPKKEMYRAKCDMCGAETELPFKPNGDKPVYCRDCFEKNKKLK